ncbi:MAG: glucose-6-phosphate isomerase family protein [Methanomethylovorans sp.]|uniref:glucose-6-phosphate isomerase family protein n=1 Tax=Methanomethylovorans sp. TaxID=2758717 RepID=UPI000AEAD102|nr:glucose-6-phosphate isomerase family protein [Methanomethylovorans sp.]
MGNELNFFGHIRTPDIRMLHDIDDVLYDTEWSRTAKNTELYYMYRDLYRNEKEHEAIRSQHLRYDITVIPPQMLGKEYVKTAGHYHPTVPGASVSYAELYQVLEGKANYLLQRKSAKGIEDVVVVDAEAGDIVMVPPGYGHITINSSSETLKMANWVCSEFSSMYDPIKERSGAAYYLLGTGYVANPKYSDIPPIRYLKPIDPSILELAKGEDMYNLVNSLDKLDFLKRPHLYDAMFSNILSSE